VEGRKIWHTAQGSYELKKGDCVFVKKGASIVEQVENQISCFIVFFMSDEFMCEVLQTKTKPFSITSKKFEATIPIKNNENVHAFFSSMMPYFHASKEPDSSLLELKFKELVLTLADNVENLELHAYFHSLLHQPKSITLQQVMEENYCFNLKLNEYAKLCNRSLSAFKRDFEELYNTSPGKWLLEKRLNHAMNLISNLGTSINDAAFESGFISASHFSRAFSQRFGVSPARMKQPVLI